MFWSKLGDTGDKIIFIATVFLVLLIPEICLSIMLSPTSTDSFRLLAFVFVMYGIIVTSVILIRRMLKKEGA